MFRECFRVTRRGSDRLKVSEIAIGESVLSLTAQNTIALCLSTCYVVASRCETVSVAASDVVQVLFCGLVSVAASVLFRAGLIWPTLQAVWGR